MVEQDGRYVQLVMAEHVGECGEGIGVAHARETRGDAARHVGIDGLGQAPQTGPDTLRATLFQQHAAARVAQEQHGERTGRDLLAGLRRGQHGRQAVTVGDACRRLRAQQAQRFAAHAYRGAEIHDRLRVIGRARFRRVCVGVVPQLLFDGAFARETGNAVIAREHALDVAIEDRKTQTVRLGEDRARGGTADARQRHQGVEIARKFAAMLLDAELRRTMQETGAPVIAQPRPEREHGVFIGGRQRRERRQALHEALEVTDDRDHLGLLQHDFGQPHAIGVARMLPGQVLATVMVVPAKQFACEDVHWGATDEGVGVDDAEAGTFGVARRCSPLMCTGPISTAFALTVPSSGGSVGEPPALIPAHHSATASGGMRMSVWSFSPSSFIDT